MFIMKLKFSAKPNIACDMSNRLHVGEVTSDIRTDVIVDMCFS